MKKNQKALIISLIPALVILLVSWGSSGHYLISYHINLHLPGEMEEFHDWNGYLADHASDADWRKGDDPDEGPRHYIDIDNYPEFIENGSISQDLQSLIDQHGAGFVDDNGYLPWATLATYDSLVKCFSEKDWEKAKFFAADLGHYVGDGFMPLHLTRNYNGQYTDNYGIHGRYESDMINRFKNEIEIQEGQIQDIENISEYVFSYIYENYKYADSILECDNYGKSINSNTSSTEYLEAMWDYSEGFTNHLLNKASLAFASLFYSAWADAGKPSQYQTSNTINQSANKNLMKVFPNPFSGNFQIMVNNNYDFPYQLKIINGNGNTISCFTNQSKEKQQTFQANMESHDPGIYTLVFQSLKRTESKMILHIK